MRLARKTIHLSNSSIFPELISSPLLADLPDGLGQRFLDRCVLQRFEERSYLLQQGGQSPGVFLVAGGHVEISYSDESGNVSIIHIAGPGEVLGEVEAIAQEPCAASCIAMPGASLLFFCGKALAPFLREPAFVRNVAGLLHRRLVHNNHAKSLADHGSLDGRLRMYLWQMSASRRTVEVSQQYLSLVVGCSRETINRKLQRLRDEGVLTLERGSITILDRERLKA